mgnify:CR=1 FL=1
MRTPIEQLKPREGSMSERMTRIELRGNKAAGPGLAEWGRKTPAEMIERYRQYARHQLAEAEAVLAATDEEFRVETYTGVHVQRNREVIQDGKDFRAARAEGRT